MLGFTRSILFRALSLGTAAGMRTMTPCAMLAWRQPSAPRHAGWRSWPILRNTWGRRALMLGGVAELAGDKQPGALPRTDPMPLAGRMLIGTLVGLAAGTEGKGKSALAKGAIAGLIGSLIGSFGGLRARQALVNMTGLPDPAVAVVEDLAAVSLANSAIQRR